MPPRKQKISASTSSNESMPTFPAPPAQIPTKVEDGGHTPDQQSKTTVANLTQVQKQALMDNLQLEITERARKLRAQYAMQAQSLRTRLEMRVNRIPQALRKRKIQDLIDEHAEKTKKNPAPPVPVQQKIEAPLQAQAAATTSQKALKRQSDQISEDHDKENDPAPPAQDLANPKKRAKTATTVAPKPARTASRKAGAPMVLSPKSHNSRTLPRSPFKTAPVVEKTQSAARPNSPVKASTTSKSLARAPSRQTKRTAKVAGQENQGRSSDASNTSATTTIVSKATSRSKTTAKKPTTTKTSTAASLAKRTTAAIKKENIIPAAAAAVGRTLRKRG